jgi:hypothetical protein
MFMPCRGVTIEELGSGPGAMGDVFNIPENVWRKGIPSSEIQVTKPAIFEKVDDRYKMVEPGQVVKRKKLVQISPKKGGLPETEAAFWKEAQEVYPHPYERGDELVHQYFNRGPVVEAPPIFPFRIGDEGTLEKLDLPVVSDYLDSVAHEKYGISNFSDIVNNQDRKEIKFIVSKTKPHSVWEDDNLLLVNLYRVHNIVDLMAVLVHEFTHVMSILAGRPMSNQEERRDATPEEYVEFPEEQDAFLEYVQFRSFILREPRDFIKEKLFEVVGRDQEEKIDEWLDYALGEQITTAGYPKHPDTVVVSSNEFYPDGLTEEDVWGYYDREKEGIVQELRGSNVMLVVKADGEIYKRHPDSKEKFIRVNNIEDFDKLNNGRTIEFHKAVGETTDYGYIDIDPKEQVSFEKAKRVTIGIYDLLSKQDDVHTVDIVYSGGRGFHIYPFYKSTKPTDRVRQELKVLLGKYIEELGDEKLSTGVVKEKDAIRLDTSTLYSMGSLRVTGSLNAKTGLRCSPVSRGALSKFEKESAKIKGIARVESSLPSSEEEFFEELVYSRAAG